VAQWEDTSSCSEGHEDTSPSSPEHVSCALQKPSGVEILTTTCHGMDIKKKICNWYKNCLCTEEARVGGGRDAYRVLVVKPEGMRFLGIPRCRREDNIKIGSLTGGLREHGLDLSDSEYGPVAECCECSNELPGSIKCGEFLD